MADFRVLSRHYPEIREYIKHRRWVDRSGVLAYAPNMNCEVFSTDDFGFRRGSLNGAPFDLRVAFSGEPYALVLGSSHVFGFGLEGDAQTIPSQLSEKSGVACLNLSFPEAQIQALHAVALRICKDAPRPPEFIALLPGGMLTRYSYVRSCDPTFGVPDFQKGAAESALPGGNVEAKAFEALLGYTLFWISQVANLAQSQGCPFLLHPEHTAFEKPNLSAVEVACSLTLPRSQPDSQRFQTHRLRYCAYTQSILRNVPNGARVAQSNPSEIGYLDEFHYTRGGVGLIASALVQALR